jgi:hypothetical protein
MIWPLPRVLLSGRTAASVRASETEADVGGLLEPGSQLMRLLTVPVRTL